MDNRFKKSSNRNNQLDDTQFNSDVENIVQDVETMGQPDPYTTVNPRSGAVGKYQLLKTYHEKPIEERYGIPFSEIAQHPEQQDDYFRNVLLPGYKKSALKTMQMFPDSGLDRETMVALQQLGPANVRKYLSGEASPDLIKQVDRFKEIANIHKNRKFQKMKKLLSGKKTAISQNEGDDAGGEEQ